MNIALLKQLGNIEQIAGIRQSRIIDGPGKGTAIASFHNAAGLRFTVLPDRGMDLYDLSFRGINLSFLSKNGLVSAERFSPSIGEFCDQWSAGAMVTCGLDNVGGQCGNCPTHGQFGYLPAVGFGTQTGWEGDDYRLSATGEIHQSRLFGRHLSVKRRIETTLCGKSIRIRDVITNHEAEDEPFMLLYHCNFGYPLLGADSVFLSNSGSTIPLTAGSVDSRHMSPPIDGCEEELFLHVDNPDVTCGILYNNALELGVYVRFRTEHLPNFLQWKRMKSHDYVMAIEPCNTCGLNRDEAIRQNKIAVLPAYSAIETGLEIGVIEGREELEELSR